MIGRIILLWVGVPVDSTTLKSAPSPTLLSTGLYFLGTCYYGYRCQWGIGFSVPLLTLLQLRSYLVLCISARVFIIPKLPNIRCKQFQSELLSLCIEHLPNCYSIRPSMFLSRTPIVISSDWCFREHISHALPSETIFYLLRSIHSEHLIRDYSPELMLDTLEIIIKWLQVSCW